MKGIFAVPAAASMLAAGIAGGLVTLTAVPGPAAAQAQSGAEGAIEEVTVLGTRQQYRGEFAPIEVPANELVLTQELLDQAGVRGLDQALDLSASVARQNNFGGLWNSFAIRGFVGDENLPSGYLVNGFNAGRGFGGPRDISGIERVEILKGPRAALFGRGEPGGTINLVTKRPQSDLFAQVRASYASFDTRRVDADLNLPVQEHLGVRLVGFWEDADSFRDTVETTRFGASPSVAVTFGDTSLLYELEYSSQELPFDRGVVAADGALGVIPVSRFLGEPGDGPMDARVLGHQLQLQHDFSDALSLLVGAGWRDTSLEGFSSEAELTGSRQRLFQDGRTLTRQRRFRDYDALYQVLRAELSARFATGPLQHRVLVGGDVDEFENDQVFLRYRAPTLASDPTLQESYVIDIFDPVYGQFPLPDVSPLTDRVETRSAVGAYLQDQISLTDRLQVRLGLRFDDFEQEVVNRASGSVAEQSDSRVSPQAGVVWAFSDALTFYGAYGQGFRALSGADVAGTPFAPNTTTSYEAGLKFDLAGGILQGTGAVFRVDQENILVADPDNPGFSLAAGEARSQGVELDLTASFGTGTDIWFSYAFVDAEVTNDVLDPNFALEIQAGDRLLNVPQHTMNLQVSQALTLRGLPLSFGGGVLYVGDRLGEVATDFELPEYTVARLFAAAELGAGVEVRAEIDNLFDRDYYVNSFAALWVQPGVPLNARISATWRFGADGR